MVPKKWKMKGHNHLVMHNTPESTRSFLAYFYKHCYCRVPKDNGKRPMNFNANVHYDSI